MRESLAGRVGFFWWRGEVQAETEVVMFLKTTRDRSRALRDRLIELHPYETPAFTAIDIDEARSNPPYVDWLRREVRGRNMIVCITAQRSGRRRVAHAGHTGKRPAVLSRCAHLSHPTCGRETVISRLSGLAAGGEGAKPSPAEPRLPQQRRMTVQL